MNREILSAGMNVGCPDCGRKLVKITARPRVVTRACSGCGQGWEVESRPVGAKQGMFHVITRSR